MDALKARRMALEAIQEHCPEFTFKWSQAKTFVGQCDHTGKVISLSRPLVALTTEAGVRDTIMHEVAHEVAHALVGPHEAHGRRWQVMARKLGARPEREADPAEITADPRTALAPWVGTCERGHESRQRFYRKPRNRRSCSQCKPGVFDEKHLLTYRRVDGK